LITIDTEGDNLWAHPKTLTTENAKYLGRFQALCERYAYKPTYLTDYEMVMCPVYREFATDAQHRGAAEIGMHLHAWNTPPAVSLTSDDHYFGPYLIEYPEPVIREKVRVLTRLLEEHFQITPVSHRAGRWAFNEVYARILVEHGYKVDCSVAPGVSYEMHLGNPDGMGGMNYKDFPTSPYFLSLDNIREPGDSDLLELPVTIMDLRPSWTKRIPRNSLVGRVVNRLRPSVAWLRPTGKNLSSMLRVVRRAAAERAPCVEFMLHSSEFMPGGSPTFATERDIDVLYEHLEALFAESSRYFSGATLAEFSDALTAPNNGRA
jgi:peptidoglycan/xylan/chitin deacetylase (PgdA/CDA1 family)